MLLSLQELQNELNAKFSHPNFDLSDLRLSSPGASPDIIRSAELSLGVVFPKEFSDLVAGFDFSRLQLANVIFEYGKNLARFIRVNHGDPFPWWGQGIRPTELLFVAMTDGHNILLSARTGNVKAISKGDREFNNGTVVADTFETFVRLAGAITLQSSKEEKVRVAAQLSPVLFWQQVAGGTA